MLVVLAIIWLFCAIGSWYVHVAKQDNMKGPYLCQIVQNATFKKKYSGCQDYANGGCYEMAHIAAVSVVLQKSNTASAASTTNSSINSTGRHNNNAIEINYQYPSNYPQGEVILKKACYDSKYIYYKHPQRHPPQKCRLEEIDQFKVGAVMPCLYRKKVSGLIYQKHKRGLPVFWTNRKDGKKESTTLTYLLFYSIFLGVFAMILCMWYCMTACCDRSGEPCYSFFLVFLPEPWNWVTCQNKFQHRERDIIPMTYPSVEDENPPLPVTVTSDLPPSEVDYSKELYNVKGGNDVYTNNN